jgi:hypothetical protein
LYNTRQLVSQLPATLKKRTDTSHAYFPLNPEYLHQTDGLLFLPTAQASQP